MSTRRKFIQSVIAGGLGGIITSGTAPVYIKDLRKRNKMAISFDEARKLHNEVIIFDAHNDTPVERVARGENVSGLLRLNKAYDTDIPRMKVGGYNAGTFIVGNGVIANVWVTLEQTLAMIESSPEEVMLVRSSKDVVRAKETGKVGILPGIEGIAKWVNGETDILRMLYRSGVKWVSITHGEGGPDPKEVSGGANSSSNGYAYKKMKAGVMYLQGTPTPFKPLTSIGRSEELKNAIGLTTFGKEILKVSNELGIVTDLAHINDRAFFDVIEHTTQTVVVSHTGGAFSLSNHTRNLTDDQIKALADNGGVMGIFFWPKVLAMPPKKVSIATYVEHIAYVANLVGVDHVGVGTDYDGGVDVLVPLTELVKVTQAMMEFGFTKEEIMKIWGGNFLRVLEQNIG